MAIVYISLFTSLFTPLLMSLPIILPQFPLIDSCIMYARARASCDFAFAPASRDPALAFASLPPPLLVPMPVVFVNGDYFCVW